MKSFYRSGYDPAFRLYLFSDSQVQSDGAGVFVAHCCRLGWLILAHSAPHHFFPAAVFVDAALVRLFRASATRERIAGVHSTTRPISPKDPCTWIARVAVFICCNFRRVCGKSFIVLPIYATIKPHTAASVNICDRILYGWAVLVKSFVA